MDAVSVIVQYTLAGAASVIGLLVMLLIGILSWTFRKTLQDNNAKMADNSIELKALRESDNHLADQIAAMRAEMPEKYVAKADSAEFRHEMRGAIDRITAAMTQQTQTMTDGFERLAEKIYKANKE